MYRFLYSVVGTYRLTNLLNRIYSWWPCVYLLWMIKLYYTARNTRRPKYLSLTKVQYWVLYVLSYEAIHSTAGKTYITTRKAVSADNRRLQASSTIIWRPLTRRYHTWHAAAIHRRPWPWLTGTAANDCHLWTALRFCGGLCKTNHRELYYHGGICAAYQRNMQQPAYKYECTASAG